MKRYQFTSLLLVVMLSAGSFSAQTTGKIKKGEKYFNGYSYSEAIKKYESFDEKTTDINRKLAQSYRSIGNTEKAEQYYTEVIAASDKTSSDVYQYAAVLSMNGKHAESEKWMKEYHTLASSDSRAAQYQATPELYKTLQKDEERFQIKNLAINSSQEDFGASYYNDKVVFCSSREKKPSIKRTWNWNSLPFLDMYISEVREDNELSEVEEFAKRKNKKYHEGPVSFNLSGDFMVFTRNNYQKKSEDGIVNLQLFYAEFKEDKWTKEMPLPYNSPEYSVGHPSLSADGNTIFFASDMPGGKGGVDLYKATRKEDGAWGEAQNLGEKINTEGNEMFPFIHNDGELFFFASDGHIGLGGLDVFITQVKTTGFGKIKNVGVPVNGIKDDFSFILDQKKEKGFFASNREEGKGDDDIYSYTLLKPFVFGKTIKGTAKDKKGNLLAETMVTLYDKQGNKIEEVTTQADGSYLFVVDADKEFQLNGTKEEYFEGKNTADTKTDEEIVIADLTLEKDPGLSLYALITDKKTSQPLSGVSMTIIDNLTGKEESFTTPETGDYRKALADKKINDRGSYNFTLLKEGYFSKTVTYNTAFDKEGQYDVHSALDLTLDPLVKDLTELIEINPINFDLNKYKIRPDAAKELDKIVEIMNKYTEMIIELGSHTDARGSDAYNRKLSDKRAKASAAYIKKHITNPKRIYGKGYGESKLINRCTNGVKCSEEEHEQNRRTEFKVIDTGNDKVKVKNNSGN